MAPARLMQLGGTIRKQICRVDGIVNKMNRFAHSADAPLNKLDLGQMMELLMSLAGRFAQLKGVAIDMADPESPVCITTSPFVLENLVWRCLDFVMDAAEGDKKLVLCTEATEEGALLRFACIGGLTESALKRFPSDTDTALAYQLKAELDIRPDAGEIIIALPDDINNKSAEIFTKE